MTKMVDIYHDIEKGELIHLMKEIKPEENNTIVFVETRRKCDEFTRKMRVDG